MGRCNFVASKFEYFQTKHPLEKYLRSLFFSPYLLMMLFSPQKKLDFSSAHINSILVFVQEEKKENFETVFWVNLQKSHQFSWQLTSWLIYLVTWRCHCHPSVTTKQGHGHLERRLGVSSAARKVKLWWSVSDTIFTISCHSVFLCVVVIESKDGSGSYRDPSPGQLTHLCGRVGGPRPNIKSGK